MPTAPIRISHEAVQRISDGDYHCLRLVAASPDTLATSAATVRHQFYTTCLGVIGDSRGVFTSGVKKESAYALRALSGILQRPGDLGTELRALLRDSGPEELRRLKLERHLASAKEDVGPAALEFVRVVVTTLRMHPSEVLADATASERVLAHLQDHMQAERDQARDGAAAAAPAAANEGRRPRGRSPQRTLRLPNKASATQPAVNPLFAAGPEQGGLPMHELSTVTTPNVVKFFAKHFGLGCVPSLPHASQLRDHLTHLAAQQSGAPSQAAAAPQRQSLTFETSLLQRYLIDDGCVLGWGSGSCGELGPQPAKRGALPAPAPLDLTFPSLTSEDASRTAPRPIMPACGAQYTVWLLDTGVVATHGTGEWGQLGIGHVQQDANGGAPIVTKPSALLRTFKATDVLATVRAGYAYATAMTTRGDLFLWGNNNHGQCSVGAAVTQQNARVLVPLKVALKGFPVVDIATGSFFVLALTAQGSVLAWGLVTMLGIGDEEQATKVVPADRCGTAIAKSEKTITTVPCRIPSLDRKKIASIAAGQWHAVAVSASGNVYTWGVGHQGRLGHGSTTQEYVPKHVRGLREKVVAAACGSFHTAVLTEQGGIYCFGDNAAGQCGAVGASFHTAPVAVTLPEGTRAIRVACGREHTSCLTADGEVFVFGSGPAVGVVGRRQRCTLPSRILDPFVTLTHSVGVGHAIALAVPRLTALLPIGCVHRLCNGSAPPIECPRGVVALALGAYFTVMTDREGVVHSFGNGEWGQLGQGPLPRPADGGVPVVRDPAPVPALRSSRVVHLAAGFAFAFALTDKGKVYFWGNNNHSQGALGPKAAATTKIDTPQEVTLLSALEVAQIACGSFFAMALMQDGSVWSWGHLDCCGHGQPCAATMSVIRQQAAAHCETLVSDASLFAVSATQDARQVLAVPVRIAGLDGIVSVAAGQWHAAALSERGTVVTWGVGNQGRLGLGDSLTKYTPTRVQLTPQVPFSSIACGSFNTAAVTPSGALFVWGDNEHGQCGFENPIASTDVPVSARAGVRTASVGRQHTIASTLDGQLLLSGTLQCGEQQLKCNTFAPVGTVNVAAASRFGATTTKPFVTRVVSGPHHAFAVIELDRPSAAEVCNAVDELTRRTSVDGAELRRNMEASAAAEAPAGAAAPRPAAAQPRRHTDPTEAVA